MPTGGTIEDMLKEHERQIQQAFRKARLDKAKTNKSYGDQVWNEIDISRGQRLTSVTSKVEDGSAALKLNAATVCKEP